MSQPHPEFSRERMLAELDNAPPVARWTDDDDIPPAKSAMGWRDLDQRGPGVYLDVTRAEYDRCSALNQSTLKRFLANQDDYCFETAILQEPGNTALFRDEDKDTDSMRWGRLFEAMLLEPETWRQEFAILTPAVERCLLSDAQKKGSKAKSFSKQLSTYQDWRRNYEQAGWAIISREEQDTASFAVEHARKDSRIAEALAGGRHNVALVWRHEATGLMLKALIDLLPEAGAILDIKTARETDERSFGRAVIDLGYDFQACWYLAGWRALGDDEKDAWGWIVTKNSRPWRSTVYMADAAWLERGRIMMEDGLQRWKAWLDSGGKYQPPLGWPTLTMPAWANK